MVHSTAFRRLKGKTQVFLASESDHYRTRLTHTLEVAQIARSLARSLGLDEDLTEAIALAHDLGHPPFGHSGERALDAAMAGFGGFDHNVQSVRVVTDLERRYPRFDGLNLSWEVIEGLVKHNGPRVRADGSSIDGSAVPRPIAALSAANDLLLASQPSLEAQCAAIADDIAYDAHDIDDGLRSGLLDLADLRDLPLTGPLLSEIDREHPGLDRVRLIAELVRRLISLLVENVLTEANLRLVAGAPLSSDEVRAAPEPYVAFSKSTRTGEGAIKRHLFDRVYKNDTVTRVMARAEAVVVALFRRYSDDLGSLPAEWRAGLDAVTDDKRARRIADFLAGMTDRFALAEYQRLFDRIPDFG